MLKAVRAAHHVRQSLKQALHTFLRMYRCTPHCTTSFSPHELLFTRPPRTKLPQIEKPDVNHDKVNQHDAKRKDIMKQYADTKNHAKPCDIYLWKILESLVPNFSDPIVCSFSDRRGRSCIVSHVNPSHQGTVAFNSFRLGL